MTLATTGSNALRHRVNGLGRVLYWTYTKYPLGEAWEAYFPTTIYLVGCNPPFSVSLYCTGDSTKKVLYHSDDTCSVTNPGGDYVISYDRRAYCPTDLSEICDNIEEPGEVEVEKTTVPLCVTVEGSFLGIAFRESWIGDPPEYYVIYNCVEGQWRIMGSPRTCQQVTMDGNLGPWGGLYTGDGEMSGDATSGWSRGSWPYKYWDKRGIVYISPSGVVSYSFEKTDSVWVTHSGSGQIALDEIYNCPVGTTTFNIYTGGWSTCYWNPYSQRYQIIESFSCATNCGDHPVVTLAGEITITTKIKIGDC